jgi:PAS domain S-box-containing protein
MRCGSMDPRADGRHELPPGVPLAWLLIVLPCLALIGLEIHQAFSRGPALTSSREWVVHTFNALSAAQALDDAVLGAERGEHGYLLTGNVGYLDVYHRRVQEIPALLASLKRLTADNPEQQGRLSRIEQQIDSERGQLQHSVDVRQREGATAALVVERADAAHKSADAVSVRIQALIAAENRLLAERLARQVDEERGTTQAALIGAAIACAIMLAGVALLLRASHRGRRIESELNAAVERFRLLVDGVSDYALYLMDPDGRIKSWNEGAQRMKGYSEEEVIGKNYSCFFTLEDQRAGVPAKVLHEAVQRGKVRSEGPRVRKDRSAFLAATVITRLRDRTGKHVGFAKITRDVTEQREHQQALEQARLALAQSQKLEALGQLTGGMAHDFNNILHVIKNSIDIVRARVHNLDPSAVQYLEMAKRNADRGAGVTQRLLAFARQQPLNPKPLNPNKLIQGMSDLLRHAVGEGIELEVVQGTSRIWTISADLNQLETAILNLAVNSRDAMQGSGKLTLETANAFLDESYAAAHAEVTAGQYVMIAVSDTGAGMTPEVMARAFDPFFTTKETGQGTGLGLSQVLGFMKQSGGHVKLYSELGVGTTVKLYFPQRGVHADSLSAEAASATKTAVGERVLLVEDEEDVRAFTREVLSELGYQVAEAPDGPSALGLLDQLPDLTLLFTDVGLPRGMNGRRLAEEVCRRRPDVKVLYTTGYARNAIVHHGRLDAGVNLIVKPFTQRDLARKIRSVIDGDVVESV